MTDYVDRAAAKAFMQFGTRFKNWAVEYVLPPQCLNCGEMIDRNGALCASCWGKVDLIERPFCPRLGIPFAFDPGDNTLSAAAIANPPEFNRARCVARYDGVVRKLVHALKYRDRLDIAPTMAGWMGLAGRELLPDCDLIIPVPLYRARLWRRRFNQSAALARELGKKSDIACDTQILRRIRPTKTQVGLSVDQRRKNVAGAFKIKPADRPKLKGLKIVLIDDVITSGATIEACTKTLLRGGAAQIDVLAFARVVDPRSLPI